jgi:hypothetical protein
MTQCAAQLTFILVITDMGALPGLLLGKVLAKCVQLELLEEWVRALRSMLSLAKPSLMALAAAHFAFHTLQPPGGSRTLGRCEKVHMMYEQNNKDGTRPHTRRAGVWPSLL